MLDSRLGRPRPDLDEGAHYRVMAGTAPLRREPRPDALLDSEALFGEEVTVFEENEGWALAQLGSDGYVGYLPEVALGAPGGPATHRVSALRTFMFPGPSIKAPPIDVLPLGAMVVVAGVEGGLARLEAGRGFVPAQHLVPLGAAEPDFVAVAQRFLGVPYLWGGKTALGLDCSGLVQVSLDAAGIGSPRDSDMQEAQLGEAVAEVGPEGQGLKRGDLLFWKGHVAIAVGDGTMLHATAAYMSVVVEPIADALVRIEASGSPLRGVRRLTSLSRGALTDGPAIGFG